VVLQGAGEVVAGELRLNGVASTATLSRTAALRIDPKRDTSSRYLSSRECNMGLVLDRVRLVAATRLALPIT